MNMKYWMKSYANNMRKKAIPILSFPGVNLIGRTVEEVVCDGEKQAECIEAIAKKYNAGAAVSLMDLSVEAEAFGAKICMRENEIPTIHGILVHDGEEAKKLEIPCLEAGRCQESIRAIKIVRNKITDRPVFAGMIGPYTLAARILGMTEIMILCYEDPETVKIILEKATRFLIMYAEQFQKAGADGVIMAEPVAGLLSPHLFEEFALPYGRQIIEMLENEKFLVIYHNCGNIMPIMEQIQKMKATAYSFGNAIDMEQALKMFPEDVFILGNVDPVTVFRNGTVEMVKAETEKVLKKCGKYSNFVISSGCDIPAETPIENLDSFFETVENFYKNKMEIE